MCEKMLKFFTLKITKSDINSQKNTAPNSQIPFSVTPDSITIFNYPFLLPSNSKNAKKPISADRFLQAALASFCLFVKSNFRLAIVGNKKTIGGIF
jgi:hypothetical protein